MNTLSDRGSMPTFWHQDMPTLWHLLAPSGTMARLAIHHPFHNLYIARTLSPVVEPTLVRF